MMKITSAIALFCILSCGVTQTAYAESDTDIIARWTAIYERHGLTEVSDTELRHLENNPELLQSFIAAQREVMKSAEGVTAVQIPAMLAAFLDSKTFDSVRANSSSHLGNIKPGAWPDLALAYAPAILQLVENQGEKRHYRTSGIQMLASMRYEPAGEVLYRMACDRTLEHTVRCWAIRYFPQLAPRLYDGIPEQYMEFVRRNYSARSSEQGDMGPELRAWVEAAAYDVLNEREIEQLKYLVTANWAGIGHAAAMSLLAQEGDTAAHRIAAKLHEQFLVSADVPWESMNIQNLQHTRSALAGTLLLQELVNAVHRHHVTTLHDIERTLDIVRNARFDNYDTLVAALELAVAEETRIASASRFDPSFPGVEIFDRGARIYRDSFIEMKVEVLVDEESSQTLIADVVFSNLTDRPLECLRPEILPKSGDTDSVRAGNFVVYDEKGRCLVPTLPDYQGGALRYFEMPAAGECRYRFELSQRFLNINQQGRYRIEFSYYDNRPSANCWQGRVVMPPIFVVCTPVGFKVTGENSQ